MNWVTYETQTNNMVTMSVQSPVLEKRLEIKRGYITYFFRPIRLVMQAKGHFDFDN